MDNTVDWIGYIALIYVLQVKLNTWPYAQHGYLLMELIPNYQLLQPHCYWTTTPTPLILTQLHQLNN